MSTLERLLVERQIATERQIEDATAKQVVSGGDLPSYLLDQIGAEGEAALLLVLAEHHGLQPAPAGQLPQPPERVLRLLPADIAQQHALYPLTLDRGALVVAVAAPLPEQVEDDLAFALGVPIVQLVATDIRIRQGLARDYKQPLDRRAIRLLARLEGRPDPNPSSRPPPPLEPPRASVLSAGFNEAEPKTMPGVGGRSTLPIPSATKTTPGIAAISIPPLAKARAAAPSTSAPSAPPLATTLPSVASVAAPRKSEESGPWPSSSRGLLRWMQRSSSQGGAPSSRPRRRGPMTAAAAEEALQASEVPEEALGIFFDFAQQFFTYSALFVVNGELASGRDAFGPGADRQRVLGVGVALDLPSCLSSAKARGTAVCAPLARDGIDASLAADLDRQPQGNVVVIPVLVRRRCVALLYADEGEGSVELSMAGEVLAIASIASGTLERLVITRKRKLAGMEPPAQLPRRALSAGSAASAVSQISREQKAETLVKALGLDAHTQDTSFLEDSFSSESAEPLSSPEPSESAGPPEVLVDDERSFADVSLDDLPEGPEAAVVHNVTRSATPATAGDAEAKRERIEDEMLRAALSSLEDWSDESAAQGDDADAPRRRRSTASLLGPHSRPIAPSVPPRTPRPRSPTPLFQPMHAEPRIIEQAPSGAEPAKEDGGLRQITLASPPPRGTGNMTALPAVAMDLSDAQSELVSLLSTADADDQKLIARALDEGVAIVPALITRLPGKLRVTRESLLDGGALPSSASALLQALVALRRNALPFLVVQSANTVPSARLFATLILGELPYAESVSALLPRFFDPDAQIRQAALTASRNLRSSPELAAQLSLALERIVRSESEPAERRAAAANTIAALASASSVTALIDGLRTQDFALQAAIAEALRELTCQEFGPDLDAWTQWLSGHGARDRVEWLLDALSHESAALRQKALSSLKPIVPISLEGFEALDRGDQLAVIERSRRIWRGDDKPRKIAALDGTLPT